MSTLETIHYTTPPTPDQLEAAACLIDSTLNRPMKRGRFHRAPFFVVALNTRAEVVGVAAIRRMKRGVAEFGHLAVDEAYRRQGIGTRLTERVISEARRQKIPMLYAWVEKTNVASMDNLGNFEFRLFGDYVRRPGKSVVKSWLYLPLSTEIDCNAVMEEIVSHLTKVG